MVYNLHAPRIDDIHSFFPKSQNKSRFPLIFNKPINFLWQQRMLAHTDAESVDKGEYSDTIVVVHRHNFYGEQFICDQP